MKTNLADDRWRPFLWVFVVCAFDEHVQILERSTATIVLRQLKKQMVRPLWVFYTHAVGVIASGARFPNLTCGVIQALYYTREVEREIVSDGAEHSLSIGVI